MDLSPVALPVGHFCNSQRNRHQDHPAMQIYFQLQFYFFFLPFYGKFFMQFVDDVASVIILRGRELLVTTISLS